MTSLTTVPLGPASFALDEERALVMEHLGRRALLAYAACPAFSTVAVSEDFGGWGVQARLLE